MNILLFNYNLNPNLKKNNISLYPICSKYTFLEKQLGIIKKLFPTSHITCITEEKNKKLKIFEQNNGNILIIENKNQDSNCLFNFKLYFEENKDNNLLFIPSNLIFNTILFKNFSRKDSKIWITPMPQELGCTITNDYLQNIMWGLSNFWTNILYLKKNEIQILKDVCKNNRYNKHFLFEGINLVLLDGGKIKSVLANSNIKLINKHGDFKKQ